VVAGLTTQPWHCTCTIYLILCTWTTTNRKSKLDSAAGYLEHTHVLMPQHGASVLGDIVGPCLLVPCTGAQAP